MNERTFRAAESHLLEDPERLRWLPPAEVAARLVLSPGMTIADVGAGTGYFAVPFAAAIGETGRVFAVDFQQEMLRKLRNKLDGSGGPQNVTLVEGEAARTTLPDGACDLVFMANIWHELDDHEAVLTEARRVLRPGGRAAILDWRDDVSPPPGPPAAHRIPLEKVRATLAHRGWRERDAGLIGMYGYLLTAFPPADRDEKDSHT